jgi:hypothetical protein
MSGRKPERTDYVYVVAANDTLGPPVRAFRTLDGAVAYAETGMISRRAVKTADDEWIVRSRIFPDDVFSVIGRVPLGA